MGDVSSVGLTALSVAAWRARESRRADRLFDDPYAEAFLAASGVELPDPGALPPPAERLWQWFAVYAPLRTRFFDDWCREACAAGCRQVVLLAAGLDTRAYRLDWPDGVRLYEADLPETLAFKERTLDAADAAPRCRRMLVGVDLREDWAEALLAAGFRPDQPTAWLAEDLLCRLGPADVTQLFQEIDELSAPGSRLAVEYAGRRGVDAVAGSIAGTPGTDFLGVPWRSAREQDAATWLAPYGWAAQEHDARQYAGLLGRSLPAGPAQPSGSGLITARR